MDKEQTIKKPIYKRVWFWVIVILLVLGIVGGGVSEESTTGDTSSNNSESTNSAALTPDQKSGELVIDEFTLAYNTISESPLEKVTMIDYPRCESEAYGLKVELDHPMIDDSYVIISVYGKTKSDFSSMKKFTIDAVLACDSSLSSNEVANLFDKNIGKEAGASLGTLKNIVFSSPNAEEPTYRVDIYTTAFED